VRAGGEQERDRHRIEYCYERQSEQADRPLKVGGRHTDQLCEISHGANIGLGAPALGVNPGLVDLQAGERLSLALATQRYRRDRGASFQRSSRTNGAAKPRRFLDRSIDLGEAPIEVGDGLALDCDASLDIGSSIREH
jgi:hypothetical protein